MNKSKCITPQVLMDYPGAGKENEQDVFLLLRPETNNYRIESSLLSVFRYSKEYNKSLKIQYLANLPGAFIDKSNMVLHHYETRVFFAKQGTKQFSTKMKQKFNEYFSKNFDDSEVIGSFAALDRLGMTSKQLFQESVIKKHNLKTNGQEVKRILDKNGREVFVINGDIPELLSKNYKNENCAVVMFRTTLDYPAFNTIIQQIYEKLTKEKLLPSQENEGYTEGSKRAFHYSKGPFEQIRDAHEYLYTAAGEKVAVSEFTFMSFLEKKNLNTKYLETFLRNPIGCFSFKNQSGVEENSLFEITQGYTYEKAYEVVKSMVSQKITYEKTCRFN